MSAGICLQRTLDIYPAKIFLLYGLPTLELCYLDTNGTLILLVWWQQLDNDNDEMKYPTKNEILIQESIRYLYHMTSCYFYSIKPSYNKLLTPQNCSVV